jgi:hypothetical protein
MEYRSLQQRIKPYKEAGYTEVRLNTQKSVLQDEYSRLLNLQLSQSQLEGAIASREADRINAIDPNVAYVSPDLYKFKDIKAKVFQLAQVSTTNELRREYPILKDKKFDLRYKSSWVECLLLIAEITKQSRLNEKFCEAVERAIEIELKSIDDDLYRHETADPDLYTILADNRLIGSSWEKNQSTVNSLMRAYVINKCREVGLDINEYFLV